MSSQANTAKLLADNPTLLRLRKLEVAEKVAANSKLNIVLGDKGLSDRAVCLGSPLKYSADGLCLTDVLLEGAGAGGSRHGG